MYNPLAAFASPETHRRSRQASTSVATTRRGKDQGREILLTNNMLQACALKRAFY
jgi:hypothetical protein